MGLARAYAAELEHLGHNVQMRDLYRMRFDPVLAAHELTPPDADNPPDADERICATSCAFLFSQRSDGAAHVMKSPT
jgi:putative NADPH-quinone reductase